MKNGYKIEHHKKFDNYRFYTISGYQAANYKNCPKSVPFESKYISPLNQHLCGGWTYFKNESDVLVTRVCESLKPAGEVVGDKDQIKRWTTQAKMAGKWYKIGKVLFYNKELRWFYICEDRTFNEIFGSDNIDKLINFYNHQLGYTKLNRYRNKKLSKWYLKWADENTCFTVKGLVLGYPIQITSIFFM